VLTIAKLGVGQEGYYLSRVASGLEDYYSGAGEIDGVWRGTGAHRLGLTGSVEGKALRALMDGAHPEGGQRLAGRAGRARVPGWDLTFSAPKSVSVLYGLGGPAVAEAVAAAHEHAVDEALSWLEAHATVSRRRIGGQVTTVAGEGLVVAGFRHRTSRLGDPQLHTHALALNVVERDDGTWGSLDSRPIYRQARTAGFLYQAVLRSELTERLGVGWGPVVKGVAEIDGIDPQLRQLFSKRRAQIADALAESGDLDPSARAAQVAAYRTRPDKLEALDGASLYAGWEAEAAAAGFRVADVVAVTGTTEPPRLDHDSMAEVIGSLSDPAVGLCRSNSTFERADVARAWCERLPPGTRLHRARLEELIDTATADARLVPIDPGSSDSPVVVGADGEAIPVGVATPRRWSTVELLAVEAKMLHRAQQHQGAGAGLVDASLVEEVLAGRGDLGDEQARMVRHLVSSGNGVDVVVGRAGTGKTYALAAAVELWRAAGYEPVGAALAARAAAELQAGAGIRSSTIAQIFVDADMADEPVFTDRQVLVVDEAAMVDTRRLDALLTLAGDAGAKVVLVGDHHQLPAVEVGGAFAALVERLDPVELTVNRRQHHLWEADTLARLRTGDGGPSGIADIVAAYRDHGRIRIGANPGEVRVQMAIDWHSAVNEGEDAVMIALRRDDVDELNVRARTLLAATGTIDDTDALHVQQRDGGVRRFSVGERVVCLRNDRRVGVHNALAGTVTALHHDTGSLTLTTTSGTEHHIPAGYLADGYLDYGYALTIHKAQGATVDRVLVLGDDRLYRQAGYTALSRGRNSNDVYLIGDDDRDLLPELELDRHQAVAEPDDPIDRFTRSLARDQAKHLATTQQADQPPTRTAAVTLAELWERHDQLLDDLGDIPADPAAEIGQCVEGLAEVDKHLADLHARQADTTGQRRWWQRTGPDRPPAAGAGLAATIEATQAQRTTLAERLEQLTTERDSYQQWLQANAETLDQVQELADEIDWRAAQAGRAAELTRPDHVVEVIGPPPVGDRTAWRAAAAAIESYNARFHDVPDHLLDQHPDHPEHHEQVRLAVGTATRPVTLDTTPTLTLN
jgi:conjugative relaxase-like TrwC/TraI family protein